MEIIANRPRQNPDIQASKTILKRALESFGIGILLMDLK
jgi:hypothetical protein